jgi:5-methylcytosine-specific restriction protein A
LNHAQKSEENLRIEAQLYVTSKYYTPGSGTVLACLVSKNEPSKISTYELDTLIREWLLGYPKGLLSHYLRDADEEHDEIRVNEFFKRQSNDDSDFQPTSDLILLDERVQHLRKRGVVVRPEGKYKPEGTTVSKIQLYARLPAVKAWVLQEAKGICELCQKPGPFLLPNGEKYLEVHHVKRLADGGPDTVENAVAVCPNCHRLLHWAVDAQKAQEKLYTQIPRLIRA